MCEYPVHDLLVSEGPKLHPQNMLTLPFPEYASHEEACILAVPAQNDYLTFFFPAITFPQHASDHPASLSHKYSKPLPFREADFRFVLLSPHLAASWNLSSVANLSIAAFGLLHVRQMSLVLEHEKSSWADPELQFLSPHPPETAPNSFLFLTCFLLDFLASCLYPLRMWQMPPDEHQSILYTSLISGDLGLRCRLPRWSWTPPFVSLVS